MYYIEDKPEAVKEIQGYLRGVGYDSLPVIISGNFDENTEFAVKDFQGKRGLDITGKVDYDTFSVLYESYMTQKKEGVIRETHDSFIVFPVTVGMSGNEIEYVNDMIIEILDYYGFYHSVRRGRFFTSATEEGVTMLQRLFNFSPTGEIDELTYERMLIERDSIFNFKS